MVAKSQVSVAWQIVFSLISPLNIWAFYRIKKLRKFVLYVLAPSIIVIVSLFAMLPLLNMINLVTVADPLETAFNKDPAPTLPPHMTPIEPQVWKLGMLYLVSIGFSIFAAYLITKWSREWNENYLEG